MKRILTFATLLLVTSSTVPAEVFKWVDEEGRVHYSDDGTTAAEDAETLTEDEGNIADPFVMPAESDSDVRLYSTRWCGVCRQAKAYLERRGIAYEEFDIERDDAALAEFRRLGGRGVPLLVVDGQTLQGFSAARLERLLLETGY